MRIKRTPDGEGSGGTTQTTQTTQTTNSGDDNAAQAAAFKSQLDRYKGDSLKLAEKLSDRVYGLRQRAQDAEARIPKDDQTIISKDDNALLLAYKELGTAEEIGGRQDQLTKVLKFQKVTEAARVAQMNPKVLSKLLPVSAVLEIGEATDADGQATQVVRVKLEGSDPVRIDEYAKKNWVEFLPALRTSQDQANGQEWISQASTTTGEAGGGLNPNVKKKTEQLQARSARADTPTI